MMEDMPPVESLRNQPAEEPEWTPFDPASVAFALNAPYAPRISELYGEGFRYGLENGLTDDADLFIFPKAATVTYNSTDLAITLRSPLQPLITTESVVFQAITPERHTSLHLNTNGEVLLLSSSVPPAHETGNEPTPLPLPPEPAGAKPPAALPKPTKETTNRHQWQGRLNAEPAVSHTPTGKTRVQFLLGEHPADDETIWHKVYSIGKYAERIADMSLQKGEIVRVTGYEQQRVVKGKEVVEIFANAVQRPKGANEAKPK